MKDLADENRGPPGSPNLGAQQPAAEKNAHTTTRPTPLPLKESPKRNMSPTPLSPTRAFSPPPPNPRTPGQSAGPSAAGPANPQTPGLTQHTEDHQDSQDSQQDHEDAGLEAGDLPFAGTELTPAPAGSAGPPSSFRPAVPGSLEYTPLEGPLDVYIHPDDARDKVLAAIIKVILRTGNTPATPRELSGLILKGNVALLGGNTPHATVSSRISQHFKRCSEHMPPRKPILGKWAGEGERKLRYYVDQDDPAIPVGDVTDGRLALKIPHTGIDDRLLPELSDTEIIIRPRRGPGEEPGSPIVDQPRPKGRDARGPRTRPWDDPTAPPRVSKTRSSIIPATTPTKAPDTDEYVPPSVLFSSGKRKRGRPPKSSYEQAAPIDFASGEPGAIPRPEALTSDALSPSDSEIEQEEDPNYGSPVRKKKRAGRPPKKKHHARQRIQSSESLRSMQGVADPRDRRSVSASAADQAAILAAVKAESTAAAQLPISADVAISVVPELPPGVPMEDIIPVIEGLPDELAEELQMQTWHFGSPAKDPREKVEENSAAVWLVELSRSQPATPMYPVPAREPSVPVQASQPNSSPSFNHPPIATAIPSSQGAASSGATEVNSSKRQSLTSPQRGGSLLSPATPPSKFILEPSTAAVTPVGNATNIVVGVDTAKVLRWAHHKEDKELALQQIFDTVRRKPGAADDPVPEVQKAAAPRTAKKAARAESPTAKLSSAMSSISSAKSSKSHSGSSSESKSPASNLDNIRKAPTFLFEGTEDENPEEPFSPPMDATPRSKARLSGIRASSSLQQIQAAYADPDSPSHASRKPAPKPGPKDIPKEIPKPPKPQPQFKPVPTPIPMPMPIQKPKKRQSKANEDHSFYSRRGFRSDEVDEDDIPLAKRAAAGNDYRVGFMMLPELFLPAGIFERVVRGIRDKHGEDAGIELPKLMPGSPRKSFPRKASPQGDCLCHCFLPCSQHPLLGRQHGRGNGNTSPKRGASGVKPTPKSPTRSSSTRGTTSSTNTNGSGGSGGGSGGAGGDDGDDRDKGRKRTGPTNEVPKDDDVTDDEEEEQEEVPDKREPRSPRRAKLQSPPPKDPKGGKAYDPLPASKMPTPEPTPARSPRKGGKSSGSKEAEFLASVIELKHLEAYPENRLQVMSIYEMDVPSSAAPGSGQKYSKIKNGMLTGILPVRLATDMNMADDVEVSVELASYINVMPVLELLPETERSQGVSTTLSRCLLAMQSGTWAEVGSGNNARRSKETGECMKAIEVVLLDGDDLADVTEDNAAILVSGAIEGLEDGESIEDALLGIWVPSKYAYRVAAGLTKPVQDLLTDLFSVDDDELGTTTEEEEEEDEAEDQRAQDSDGDIELPSANAELLASMTAEAGAGGDTKIAQMLPPASASVLMGLIGGRGGSSQKPSKTEQPEPTTRKSRSALSSVNATPKRNKNDLGQGVASTFSPVLRELFADDDASLFSGDETQSYFNLSSDDDGALDLSDPADFMEEEDVDFDELPFKDLGEKDLNPEEVERAAKLEEAGLPNISVASLELQGVPVNLPPPSAPIWRTVIDDVECYLTLLPRPRVNSVRSQPSTPNRSDAQQTSALSLLGTTIPIIRRVEDGCVNATTLLVAGGLVSDRERSTVLSLEVIKSKIRKKMGLLGTWIPLKRARELSRTYLLEAKLAFFLSDGLPKVFAGVPRPTIHRPQVMTRDKTPVPVSLPEGNVHHPVIKQEQEAVPEVPTEKDAATSAFSVNEKLIKKLKKLVDSGGPQLSPMHASIDGPRDAFTSMSGIRQQQERRRASVRPSLQALNATLTSISTGTQGKGDHFLISPTLLPTQPPKVGRSGTANSGRWEIQPPSSLVNDNLHPTPMHEAETMLAQEWASSSDDDEEKVERRREAFRRRTAAIAAAEAAALAKAASGEEHGTDDEDEEEDIFSWSGSDDEGMDLPGAAAPSSEEEGYERDDEIGDGDSTDDEEDDDTPTAVASASTRVSGKAAKGKRKISFDEDDMSDGPVERTIIVTTSINIPSATFKGRQTAGDETDEEEDDIEPEVLSRAIRLATRGRQIPSGIRLKTATGTPRRVLLPPVGSFGGPVLGSFGSPTLSSGRLTPPNGRPVTPKLEAARQEASFPRLTPSPPLRAVKRTAALDIRTPEPKRARGPSPPKVAAPPPPAPSGDETEEEE